MFGNVWEGHQAMKRHKLALCLAASVLVLGGVWLALGNFGSSATLSSQTPVGTGASNAGATVTATWMMQQAQLYPTPQPSFETFKQYPGAQYLEETDPFSDSLSNFEFETHDSQETVEAYYKNVALKHGWVEARVEGHQHNIPRFYYGDLGKEHVYGYYLSFQAYEPGQHLKTHTKVWIRRSLPRACYEL